MKLLTTCAFLIVMFVPALADDAKPRTVGDCITILNGLSSLNYVGQQLGDASKPPDGAKQYKLGALRFQIAVDISNLRAVADNAQKAQAGFQAELLPIEPNKPDTAAKTDEQNKLLAQNWQKILAQPCNATINPLPLSGLNIGDGPNDNQFPPSVLGAIVPIISDSTK